LKKLINQTNRKWFSPNRRRKNSTNQKRLIPLENGLSFVTVNNQSKKSNFCGKNSSAPESLPATAHWARCLTIVGCDWISFDLIDQSSAVLPCDCMKNSENKLCLLKKLKHHTKMAILRKKGPGNL